jgi:hypothetical protein
MTDSTLTPDPSSPRRIFGGVIGDSPESAEKKKIPFHKRKREINLIEDEDPPLVQQKRRKQERVEKRGEKRKREEKRQEETPVAKRHHSQRNQTKPGSR